MKAEIRKIVVTVEETRHEMGKEIDPPTRKAVAAAVIKNPFAGLYVEDLEALDGNRRGARRAARARRRWPRSASRRARSRAMARPPSSARRASGSMPPPSCIPASASRLRAAVEKGAALVPSAKKLGGLGTAIDVPLGHKDAAFVRSHFDAVEIRIPDAPRGDEIVVAVAVTDSGRPLARVGGLQKNEIKGEDGLR